MKLSRRIQGKKREQEAIQVLKQIGYQIISENYQKRGGEIDLIALDEPLQVLAFIEIRTRNLLIQEIFGSPLESLTAKKIAKIRQISLSFIQENPNLINFPLRFDLLAGSVFADGTIQWELLKDAFR